MPVASIRRPALLYRPASGASGSGHKSKLLRGKVRHSVASPYACRLYTAPCAFVIEPGLVVGRLKS